MTVRMGMRMNVCRRVRRRVILIVGRQLGGKRGKTDKLWMDMKEAATRMMVMERANLGESQRKQKCPKQDSHQSLGAHPLFSENSHVALPLLLLKLFLSFLTNTSRDLDVDDDLLMNLLRPRDHTGGAGSRLLYGVAVS